MSGTKTQTKRQTQTPRADPTSPPSASLLSLSVPKISLSPSLRLSAPAPLSLSFSPRLNRTEQEIEAIVVAHCRHEGSTQSTNRQQSPTPPSPPELTTLCSPLRTATINNSGDARPHHLLRVQSTNTTPKHGRDTTGSGASRPTISPGRRGSQGAAAAGNKPR